MHWGLNWECTRKMQEMQLGCSRGGMGMAGMQPGCHAGEDAVGRQRRFRRGAVGFTEDAVGLW